MMTRLGSAFVALMVFATPFIAQAKGLTAYAYPNAVSAARAGAAGAISRYTNRLVTPSSITGDIIGHTTKTETFLLQDPNNYQVKQSVLQLKDGTWKAYVTDSVKFLGF